MAVKTENQLSPHARSLWLKALSAFEQRNFGYVVQLARPVLEDAPDFLAGRQMLRHAELALAKGNGKGLFKGMTGGGLSRFGGGGLGKRDPRAAMESAEDTLEKDPTHQGANLLLREAAMALDLPEVASFALETLRDAYPNDTKILHELARHYRAVALPEKAIHVYNAIVEVNPTDLEAIKGGKDAAASATIRRGGWELAASEGGSYRDALRSQAESASLERQASMVTSVESIEVRLGELYAQYHHDQRDLNVVRRIAALNEQKDDYATALEWYQYAVTLTHHADPGLVRKVSDLGLKHLDYQIKSREDWLETHRAALVTARDEAGGLDPEIAPETVAAVAQYEHELEAYRQQRAAQRVDDARRRVERNPTDLSFRYELGEQLVGVGDVTAAIPELQRAAQSPSLGAKAMNLLAQCFEAKGIVNLAVKQYEGARERLPTMDALKKDVTYRVALVYEKTGDRDRCLERMTEVYEVDAGYRDVAARVEGSCAG